MPLQVVETTGLKQDSLIGIKLEDKRLLRFPSKVVLGLNLFYHPPTLLKYIVSFLVYTIEWFRINYDTESRNCIFIL